MFQFPRFASYAYFIQHKMTHECAGFPHSDIVDYNGCYYLIYAFRKLLRPSSPLIAKASTVYAYSLNYTTQKSRLSFSIKLRFKKKVFAGYQDTCKSENNKIFK